MAARVGGSIARGGVHSCGNGGRGETEGPVLPIALTAIAASALLIMLVRARHDPGINQGNPGTLTTLADVVARRQYDVSPMWPRQAPVWLRWRRSRNTSTGNLD